MFHFLISECIFYKIIIYRKDGKILDIKLLLDKMPKEKQNFVFNIYSYMNIHKYQKKWMILPTSKNIRDWRKIYILEMMSMFQTYYNGKHTTVWHTFSGHDTKFTPWICLDHTWRVTSRYSKGGALSILLCGLMRSDKYKIVISYWQPPPKLYLTPSSAPVPLP